MADGDYFEIVNAPHINRKVSDFDDIWCAEANSNKDDSYFTAILLFQKHVLATTRHGTSLFLCNDEKSHTDYSCMTKIALCEN